MLLHLTRGFTALLNLIVSSLLTAWFCVSLFGWHGVSFASLPNIGDFLMLLALVLLTVTGTGAGLLLARRRTAEAGIKWHFAAGLSWPLLLCGFLLLSRAYSSHLFSIDWSAIRFFSGLTGIWFFLGWALSRLLHLDTAKQSALLTVSDLLAAPIEAHIPTTSTISLAATEAAPTMLVQHR